MSDIESKIKKASQFYKKVSFWISAATYWTKINGPKRVLRGEGKYNGKNR
jgi:hypothetical protein